MSPTRGYVVQTKELLQHCSKNWIQFEQFWEILIFRAIKLSVFLKKKNHNYLLLYHGFLIKNQSQKKHIAAYLQS